VDIMTYDSDEDRDQALREEHERFIRSTFGDDAFIGLATDQPAVSSRPSTGQAIAQDLDKARREYQREKRDRDLAILAAHRADEAAYDLVTTNPAQATDQDKAAAHRFARREGRLPKRSSVQELIQMEQRSRS
jgi:hypothetical protein